MKAFTSLTSKACPLGLDNVDTDQLIPARFMKRPRSQGYGDVLLHDLRRHADGTLDPQFPLNQKLWQDAQIVIAGRNFGGGSSREAAVYALVDAGIRCVIAPSLGDIFKGNAVNNGLLPIALPPQDCAQITALVTAGADMVTVDLGAQTISCGQSLWHFPIDPIWRLKLLNGWDDIGLTASHAAKIAAFQDQDAHRRPWALPRRNDERTSP